MTPELERLRALVLGHRVEIARIGGRTPPKGVSRASVKREAARQRRFSR